MSKNPASINRVKRPFWLVIVVVLVGSLLISGILALVDYYLFYALIINALLIGLVGGIFSWVIFEEKNLQATYIAALGGALIGLFIFVMYRYMVYRLVMADLDFTLSFWEYTQRIAEGGVSIVRGGAQAETGIKLSTTLTWGLWLAEVAAVTIVGGALAKSMDVEA